MVSRGAAAVVAVVACLAAAVASVDAAGWTQTAGNAQHTGASPFTISTGGHPQWSYSTGSVVKGSIIINSAGTQAYVGATDGVFTCLNVDTADTGGNDIKTGFGDGVSVNWAVTLAGPVAAAPTFSADESKIYVSGGSTFYCLDASSGSTVWTFDAGDTVSSAATLNSDLVFFGSASSFVYALYQANGTVFWKCFAKDEVIGAPTVSSDGLSMYFGSSDTYVYGFTNVYGTTCRASGFQASSCQDWVDDGTLQEHGCASWWVSPDAAAVTSPVTLDETNSQLLIASAAQPGTSTISSIDLTGVGSAALPSTAVKTLYSSQFSLRTGITLVGATNTAVFGSDDGNVYAISVTDGTTSWSYNAGQPVVSTPVTDGTSIAFGGTDGTVYCISASSGSGVWAVSTGASVVAPPAVAPSGMVLVGNTNGGVQAIGTVDITVVRILSGVVIAICVIACCLGTVCLVRSRRRRSKPALQNLDGFGSPAVVGVGSGGNTGYARMMHDDEDHRL